MSNTTTAPVEQGVAEVPIAEVSVKDGFNPRTGRDRAEFARTVASVAATGVLQPILVTPEIPDDATADDPRRLRVIAGEGRCLAAIEAQTETLPVIVRNADEQTGGLEWTIEENVAREQMNPVDLARGWQRLKAAGWSPKQIAARFSVSQKLVTERLRILQIPEGLHPQVADGTIPLSAIRLLADLAKAHGDLPAMFVARVSYRATGYDDDHSRAWGRAVRCPAEYLGSWYANDADQPEACASPPRGSTPPVPVTWTPTSSTSATRLAPRPRWSPPTLRPAGSAAPALTTRRSIRRGRCAASTAPRAIDATATARWSSAVTSPRSCSAIRCCAARRTSPSRAQRGPERQVATR